MYDFLLCNFYMLICLVLNVEISIMALNYCDIESCFFLLSTMLASFVHCVDERCISIRGLFSKYI